MQPGTPPYLLGIDVGTTNLKANLYDVAGNWIAGSSVPMRAVSPPGHPDWSAYDPDELWNNTVENLRRITRQVEHPESIAALAVVGMGEPIIPVDGDGTSLYPAICWFDRRTEPQARWWRQHFGARRMYAITGQPISFFLSLNSIMWIREHEPAIFSHARKWLVVEDYLIFRLTGSHATDYSIASRTMGFDVTGRAWSEEVFAAADLDPASMAEAHPSGTPVGTIGRDVAALTGLAAGTIVATGGHDHGCATLPARGSGAGSILNSSGCFRPASSGSWWWAEPPGRRSGPSFVPTSRDDRWRRWQRSRPLRWAVPCWPGWRLASTPTTKRPPTRCTAWSVSSFPTPGAHEQYDRCYRDIYSHLYPSLSALNAAIAGIFPPPE